TSPHAHAAPPVRRSAATRNSRRARRSRNRSRWLPTLRFLPHILLRHARALTRASMDPRVKARGDAPDYSPLLRQRPRDHHALDIRGALVDLADADVAVDALDREIGEIAVAAMDLDGVGTDAFGHLAGEQLGHRRLLEAGLAGVAQAGGVQHQM